MSGDTLNPQPRTLQALTALSEQLIQQGCSILFTTCSLLGQQLLLAKRELRLPKKIRLLLTFNRLIIDDVGKGRPRNRDILTVASDAENRPKYSGKRKNAERGTLGVFC